MTKKITFIFFAICSLLLSQNVSAENYTITVTTNMEQYSTYSIGNLSDGNFSTKFWSNSNQTSDHYVQADLGSVQPLGSLKFYFCSGDQPNGGTVSISSDGSNFEDVATFTNSEIDASTNHLYSCDATDKSARYVRLTLNPNTAAWFQMAEIEISAPEAPATPCIVTFPASVENGSFSVQDNGANITSGATIMSKTQLTIVTTPDTGYEVNEITVNEKPISGNSFILTGDSYINVSFQKETSKAVLVPAQSGSKHYQFRFDDIVLGEHVNGTNNQLDGSVTSDHRTRNFTMTAWVCPQNLSGHVMGYGQKMFYNAEGTCFVRANSDGTLALVVRRWVDGGNCPVDFNITTDATLTIGEWACLTIVVNDTDRTISLYKNGHLAITQTISENGIGMLQDESIFYVGNGDWTGYVDEVQVWNKALTTDEVRLSLRGYQNKEIPENLVAYYNVTSASEAELTNKGSYQATSVIAGVYEGTSTYQNAPYWGYVYTGDYITTTLVNGHVFPTVTVEKTVGEHGTVEVLLDGTEVVEFPATIDMFSGLTITAKPEPGYGVASLTVNDEPFENGSVYALEANTTIEASFHLVYYEVTVTTEGELNYEIYNGETILSETDLQAVAPNTVLKLVATPLASSERIVATWADTPINLSKKEDGTYEGTFTVNSNGTLNISTVTIPTYIVTVVANGASYSLGDKEDNKIDLTQVLEGTEMKLVVTDKVTSVTWAGTELTKTDGAYYFTVIANGTLTINPETISYWNPYSGENLTYANNYVKTLALDATDATWHGFSLNLHPSDTHSPYLDYTTLGNGIFEENEAGEKVQGILSLPVNTGSTVNITLTLQGDGDIYPGYLYVDWNKDGDFIDGGERVSASESNLSSTTMPSFTVPTNLFSGMYRARFMVNQTEDTNILIATSDNVQYGPIAVDFMITLMAPETSTDIEEVEEAVELYYANGAIYTNLEGEIAIYDLSGKLVRRAQFAPVAIDGLESGIYIVRANGKTLKFIK